jgi:hypothetical protein
MKKSIVFCGFLAIMLMSTASYSLDKFKIIPSVSVTEEYNDNLFLAESDTEDDFITTVFPKIEIHSSPNRYLDLDLNYGLRFKIYADHSDLNDTSIRETQNVEFDAQARPLNRLFIDITDTYKRVPIDVDDSVAEGNVFFNMTERNTFFISPYVELPVTTTVSTRVGYSYTNIWHSDDESIDSDSYSAFVTLDKRFSSKVEGTLRYSYQAYRPESTDVQDIIEEYDRQEGSAMVVYRANPNLEIRGEIGQAWTDFEEEEDDDTDNTFWSVETTYSFGSSEVGAGYSYDLLDSSTAGAYKSQRIYLSFATGKTLRLTVTPDYTENKYLNVDRKDELSGIALEISRPLSQKIDIVLTGAAETQKFLPEDREVDRYSLGGILNYIVSRSITASAGYRFNNRDSTLDTADFDNNIAWLQAEVIF